MVQGLGHWFQVQFKKINPIGSITRDQFKILRILSKHIVKFYYKINELRKEKKITARRLN